MIDAMFARRLDVIFDRLTTNGGVETIWMRELKELNGGMKLGSNVRSRIEEHLAYRRIGFVGETLPNDENASVRLFLKGSPVARLIEAVERKGAAADEELRELSVAVVPRTTQELVREIVAVISKYEKQ